MTGSQDAYRNALVMAGLPFRAAFPNQYVECSMEVSGTVVGHGKAMVATNNGLYLWTPGYGNSVEYLIYGTVIVEE